MFLNLDRALALTTVLAFTAFGFALFSQHVLGMQPCAWCILQRMICLATGVIAGLGWLLRGHRAVAVPAAVVAILLSIGGAVAAWYQHTVASQLFTCDMTLADRIVGGSGLEGAMPGIFGIYATCADSAVTLLGVRYELWTLALFSVLAVIGAVGLARRGTASGVRPA
jgi:disulfide bond formation protein DsbB